MTNLSFALALQMCGGLDYSIFDRILFFEGDDGLSDHRMSKLV